jgi:hypothetical protein
MIALLALSTFSGRAASLLVLALLASAKDVDALPLPLPRNADTIAAAHLSPGETEQILGEIEKTCFDVPEDWAKELRLRRVPFAGGEALVLRGTNLLCGGTGNCQTWLFRRANSRWANLIEGEAPVVAGFGVRRTVGRQLPDVVATAHVSAGASSDVVYVFDGTVYRAKECHDIVENGEATRAKVVPCK